MTAADALEPVTPQSQASRDVAPVQPPNSASSPDGRLVGDDGCPVRAIAFSSGGLENAMQLGVTHALLVIQGKPPDAAVGVSAGAISAVALAEILQAKAPQLSATDRSERNSWLLTLQARVKRFREVLDGFQRAPSELIDAAKPDALQLDARIPLEPLKLPIHNLQERIGRDDSLRSRAGLIGLYNQLLDLRISWGTITRFARRALGIVAAPELRPSWKAKVAVISGAIRAWVLLGLNLFLVAPLLKPLGRPYFRSDRPFVKGKSAADVIFRSRFADFARRVLAATFNFTLLTAFWFGASFFVVLLLPYTLGRILGNLIPIGWRNWVGAHHLEMLKLLVLLILALGIAAVIRHRDARRIGAQLTKEILDFVLLLFAGLGTIWLAVFAWRLARNDRPRLSEAISIAAAGNFAAMVEIAALLAIFSILCVWFFGKRFPRDYQGRQDYVRRMLANYNLADGLLSEHPLRQLLVSTLDPTYYGSEQIDQIVDRALRDDTSSSKTAITGRLIGSYSNPQLHEHPIHVGIAVANVATGQLETIAETVPSVDGLLAATAVTPLYSPQKIKETPSSNETKLFIDAANISTDATRIVTDFLRAKINPQSTVLHVYTAVALPFTRGALGGPVKSYLKLVEVVRRALQLQRFRDASLDRELTQLYTKIIRPDRVRITANDGKEYLRTWVTPIEPERPLSVTKDLLHASDKIKRREVVAQAVADGCRAALEVMIRPSLGQAQYEGELPCRAAVTKHLDSRRLISRQELPTVELPGSDPSGGPGLAEVCRYCALQSTDEDPALDRTIKQSIRVHPWVTMGPAWPHEFEKECEPNIHDAHFAKARTAEETKTKMGLSALGHLMTIKDSERVRSWPLERNGMPGSERPLVSLLFSGGVFRGVFQMGVLTALSESGIQPDIIAGASVGSITAALVAESFGHKPGTNRDKRIARLAATYLALDRLVLTDRFADFIRNFTLRSAATGFSLRKADRFLRRYDSPSPRTFDSEARTVMAGLERLLYVSPFELKNLVKAFRAQDVPTASALIDDYIQEWLERMGCGNQLLGAEPLALVITEHVLEQLAPGHTASAPIPFDVFLQRGGIYFLATTTNLTEGRLEVLGEQQLNGPDRQALLLEGLLASSAFPGVFRPRWSWELMPYTVAAQQYIDGGVMDNLPLDAVAHFLDQASLASLVKRRPATKDKHSRPHLVFAASLEIEEPQEIPPEEVELLSKDWVRLSNRASAIKYNKKLQGYRDAQLAVRSIWETPDVANTGALEPLDLEVVTVIPKWLCPTFAFHPMLGFRRERQAESIAHGCASTLIALGGEVERNPDWAAGWGIDAAQVPSGKYVNRKDPYEAATAKDVPRNYCWLRPEIVCPFSRPRVQELELPPQTVTEIEKIHLACRRRRTHLPH